LTFHWGFTYYTCAINQRREVNRMFEILGSSWTATPVVYWVWKASRAMKAAREAQQDL
jgi:hypothetical protein